MIRFYLLLCAIFGGLLAYQWMPGAEGPSETRVTDGQTLKDDNSGETGLSLTVMPPLQHFSELGQRPLFAETRRPDEKSEEPSPSPPKVIHPASKLPIQLTAILDVAGKKFALLKGVKGEKGAKKVQVGETIDGWKLTTIDEKTITFNNGSTKEVYPLRKYKKVSLPAIPQKTAGKRVPVRRPIRNKGPATVKLPVGKQ